LLLALVVLALSGCAASTPAATPTTVPTIAVPTATTVPSATAAPTSTPEPTEIAYPYPVEEEMSVNPYPYPVGEGATPGGSPVRENRSRVTAQLIEQAPDPDNAGFVRLHVLVTAVEEIEGMANLAAGLVNTETDLYASGLNIPVLKAGEVFSAEVSFRGDENGAKLYVILFD
jgi:hypothetical protein